MTIASSQVVWQVPQVDGRISALLRCVDQLGLAYMQVDLAPVGSDMNARLAAFAAIVDQSLTDGEIASNVSDVMANGSLATPTTAYSTATANFSALRVAYATATRTEAVMIGDFLNTLTDAQLRNAFNLTQTQVTNLRTNKLQPAATLATQIRAAAGA